MEPSPSNLPGMCAVQANRSGCHGRGLGRSAAGVVVEVVLRGDAGPHICRIVSPRSRYWSSTSWWAAAASALGVVRGLVCVWKHFTSCSFGAGSFYCLFRTGFCTSRGEACYLHFDGLPSCRVRASQNTSCCSPGRRLPWEHS